MSKGRRSRARRCLGALALVLGLAALAGAPAATASAARHAGSAAGPAAALHRLRFGVRLVDVPVDEAHNPRALRYIIDFLPTGSVIHRRIMIINDEPRPARFTVYPDAAHIRGGNFIGAPDHTRSELTSWITVSRPRLTIGPHRSAMVTVTIRVPARATRGEHYGVIWAQQAVRARSRPKVFIHLVARVGIRIYLAIGHGGVPPTRFAITSLTDGTSPHGRLSVVARVHNTGGRAVDLAGQLWLTGGPGGVRTGPFTERRVVTLAPGQSGSVVFVPPRGLPTTGSWHAKVILVSGVTRVTAHATITFVRTQESASWLGSGQVLWGGTGAALALAVIALAFAGYSRRRAHA